ncbi:MAG: ABC transporter permease [Anaerolineaceae bacterium]|nr:ABC transporter permease [Anaerolineaceae bacterium]
MDKTELLEDSDIPITILKPPKGLTAINLRDLWLYRELIFFMIWRDLKVRYKQTLLGVSWAVIKPFMTMVVFSIFFGNLAGVPSDGVPYPIFTFTALVPWEMFANALSVSSRSLVQNRHMITKVYFPRIILPLSSVLAGVVDFLIAFVILIGMMFYYKIELSNNIWYLPLFLLLAIITAIGVGLWLSALNVLYRDVNYVTPFLTQFWLFITPVAYPSSLLSEKWRILYALNPMTGVAEGFRWALLGTEQNAPGVTTAVSVGISILLLITGLIFFRRTERKFADMV